MMKKALRVYIAILCWAILYCIVRVGGMKTHQLSSQSRGDAFQASQMYVLHYHVGYGQVSM